MPETQIKQYPTPVSMYICYIQTIRGEECRVIPCFRKFTRSPCGTKAKHFHLEYVGRYPGSTKIKNVFNTLGVL